MRLGIVGLPNVGKSTLFNAITKAGAEAANYPFCTIEPNVGVVTVPDERLKVLHDMYKTVCVKLWLHYKYWLFLCQLVLGAVQINLNRCRYCSQ